MITDLSDVLEVISRHPSTILALGLYGIAVIYLAVEVVRLRQRFIKVQFQKSDAAQLLQFALLRILQNSPTESSSHHAPDYRSFVVDAPDDYRSDEIGRPDPNPRGSSALKTWLEKWREPERRRTERIRLPHVVASYWTGSAPMVYQVGDISSKGFYLFTEERWFPGTIVLMTLQRTDTSGRETGDAIAVQSRVVRWGTDGIGLAFVPSRAVDTEAQREQGVDEKTLEEFVSRLNVDLADLLRALHRKKESTRQ